MSGIAEKEAKRFSLGRVLITPQAQSELHPEDVFVSLHKHATCNWGDCCPSDAAENDLALDNYLRIFSVYHDRKGTKFWIITEADRSATTVLLPEDY